MAIMKQCCCCGVRSGSTACGIYSMIIAILGIAAFTFYLMIGIPNAKELLIEIQEIDPEVLGDLDIDTYICTKAASFILGLVFLVSVFFTSIVLMVGISKDSKGMLIPFMVSKGVGLFWYVFAFAVEMYGIVQLGMEYAGFTVLGFLIVLGPFFAADIVCLLCVLSQYQEYRDGRGRLCDNGAQRQTTIIVQQQSLPPGAGGFAYKPMQNPPPYASAPALKGVPGAI